MRLRYAGVCRVCEAQLPAKTHAIYERTTKTVRCLEHDASTPVEATAIELAAAATEIVVESGTAGASARREFERLLERRRRTKIEPSRPGRNAGANCRQPGATPRVEKLTWSYAACSTARRDVSGRDN